MSDAMQMAPRLGPGVLTPEELAAQRETHTYKGSLGSMFAEHAEQKLGPATGVGDAAGKTDEKPKRKRKPKAPKAETETTEETTEEVVDGENDELPPGDADEATEDEEDEDEEEGEPTPLLPL